jgi:hypothetical protein
LKTTDVSPGHKSSFGGTLTNRSNSPMLCARDIRPKSSHEFTHAPSGHNKVFVEWGGSVFPGESCRPGLPSSTDYPSGPPLLPYPGLNEVPGQKLVRPHFLYSSLLCFIKKKKKKNRNCIMES